MTDAWKDRFIKRENVTAGELANWFHSHNFRTHPEVQREVVEASLDTIGWFDAVKVAIWPDGTRKMYDGHERVELVLARFGPDQEMPCDFYALNEAETNEALKIKDQSAGLAIVDMGVLQTLRMDMPSLNIEPVELMLDGLQGLEVEPENAGSDTEPQIDKAQELLEKWQVKTGDLWQLGEHRLICGDCTDEGVVERVMDGGKAHLTFTSPPYWVGKEYEKEKTWEEVQDFIKRCSSSISGVSSHRIVINSGAPPAAHLTGERAHVRLLIDDWQRELYKYGFLMRYVRIWAKRGGLVHTAPVSDCIDQHWEFIAVFYNPDTYEGQRRLGEKWATDGLWDDFSGKMSSHGHIAAFPLELPERNIRLYTDKDAVILEPFSGSGTTLIACQNLNRRCRAVEISPAYVAVSLERFYTHANIEPKLIT